MALSISSQASSLSSFSFTSLISRNPNSISIPQPPKTLPLSLSSKTTRSLSIAATVATPAESELVENLKKYVKSRLPGGFATQTIIGTGRRKCAIARVVLQEGTGRFIINYCDAKEYLQGNPLWLQYIKVPLETLGYETSYDEFVKAHGGGLSGQALAISLGIARALLKVSADHRSLLKKEGLLTRDSTVVESKNVGLKNSRKAPQFYDSCKSPKRRVAMVKQKLETERGPRRRKREDREGLRWTRTTAAKDEHHHRRLCLKSEKLTEPVDEDETEKQEA